MLTHVVSLSLCIMVVMIKYVHVFAPGVVGLEY